MQRKDEEQETEDRSVRREGCRPSHQVLIADWSCANRGSPYSVVPLESGRRGSRHALEGGHLLRKKDVTGQLNELNYRTPVIPGTPPPGRERCEGTGFDFHAFQGSAAAADLRCRFSSADTARARHGGDQTDFITQRPPSSLARPGLIFVSRLISLIPPASSNSFYSPLLPVPRDLCLSISAVHSRYTGSYTKIHRLEFSNYLVPRALGLDWKPGWEALWGKESGNRLEGIGSRPGSVVVWAQ
ncbi:conserved hypothetical protein [Histoplasma capsulatum H143]|uniref:Uncharacterized protein n=1 Tax=Ajellomyces capsulatus (strain H143) TaxID=544712 RepID=C6H8A3_AJECH|nr:conserved hypothetical protein [Histoplasma capsulatum H143]